MFGNRANFSNSIVRYVSNKLTKMNTGNAAKLFEELLKIFLGGGGGNIGHPDSRNLVPVPGSSRTLGWHIFANQFRQSLRFDWLK